MYPCTDILEKNDLISTESNNHNLDMETWQEHLKQFLLSSHYHYGRRTSGNAQYWYIYHQAEEGVLIPVKLEHANPSTGYNLQLSVGST